MERERKALNLVGRFPIFELREVHGIYRETYSLTCNQLISIQQYFHTLQILIPAPKLVTMLQIYKGRKGPYPRLHPHVGQIKISWLQCMLQNQLYHTYPANDRKIFNNSATSEPTIIDA